MPQSPNSVRLRFLSVVTLVCASLQPWSALAQDGFLSYGTSTVVPGSTTPVEIPIFLEVRAGTFNRISCNVFTTNPGVTVLSIAAEPTIAGVTPDFVSTLTNNLVIELDDSATPTPIGPFARQKIATVSLDASVLAAGEISRVFSFAKVIDTGTSTYSAGQVEGAVFGSGNSANQLYFADSVPGEVYRVLLDGMGSVATTTTVTPSPPNVQSVGVGAHSMAWLLQAGTNTVSRYNGTGLVDSIAIGIGSNNLGVAADGSVWVSRFFSSVVEKISAPGELLYGGGGILGPAIAVTGRPTVIAGDPFGFVWVLSIDGTNPAAGALTKLGPDGEVVVEVLFTNGETARSMAIDQHGYVWVGMFGEIRIFNSDGTVDQQIPYVGTADRMVIRAASDSQLAVIPLGAEAWTANSGTSELRRVRRDASVTSLFLTSLTCTFGDIDGLHVDGLGQVWAQGDGGCAVSVDATTTGAPAVLEELPGFMTDFGNLGDSSGYVQANVLHGSGSVFSDIDNDGVSNRAELLLGTSPFAANAVVLPPVSGLACVFNGTDVDITWTNGSATYTGITVCINGTETLLAGSATSFAIVAAADDVYNIEISATDSVNTVNSATESCQVVVGPGTVAMTAAVGLSIFDITATGLSAPDPAYYVTDVGTNTILALDASFNVLADLGNPFVDSVPRGIAYDPPGIPFQGPVTGSLILTGHKPNDSIKAKRTDLNGTPTSLEFDLLDEMGNQFNTSEPPKGLAHDDATNILAMSGPVNCEMFSYNIGGAFFVGPTSLTAALKWTHPNPASSLNGIELESFGVTGGTAWLSQATPADEFEIQRVSVSATGVVTLLPEALTLGAVPEISVGGFSFTPDPVVDNTVAVVGISTSTVYAVSGISEVFPVAFDRGDCNNDGMFDIGDQVFMLSMLFSMGTPAACRDACDNNDDGGVDVGDAVYGLIALFSMGPPPPPPFGSCGIDPTIDNTPCDSFASCP
ncbi:MAG: hypothetical protein AAF581_09170 [Planctomycetota bacterium]